MLLIQPRGPVTYASVKPEGLGDGLCCALKYTLHGAVSLAGSPCFLIIWGKIRVHRPYLKAFADH
eukprot:30037-Eustigmatos_ZCMA.PRE.1